LRLNPAELNPDSERPPPGTKRRRVTSFHQRLHHGLHHDEDGDTNTGVQQIKEEIFPVDKVDVAIIRVSPAHRPRIHEFKAVAAILKLRLAGDDYGFRGESMAAAKVSAEFVVRNASALAGRLRVPGLSCMFLGPRLFTRLLLCPAFLLLLPLLWSGRFGLVGVRRLGFILLRFVLPRLRLGFFLAWGPVFLGLIVLRIESG
jgi:hypothetical protein